jgi:4'-phosphopantetheinyl transferase
MTALLKALTSARDSWMYEPKGPHLFRHELHVWIADLTTVQDDACSLLSPHERLRAERFPSASRGRLWACSRGVLRKLLGDYLRRDPRALRFDIQAGGRPFLVEDPAAATEPLRRDRPRPAGLWFNLSHSAGTAVYAFSAEAPVGVDVELPRRQLDAVALAARAFGPAQARRLAALDPASAQREFRRAWVRHEAVLKCLGLGLGARQAGDQGDDAAQPWIAELDLGTDRTGAVAAMNRPTTLSCWGWPPARAGAGRRDVVGARGS